MIASDDPRHGSQAGAVAHWRAGERPCDACRAGAMRAKKRRQLQQLSTGQPANVPLGDAAHTIIATTNRKILSAGTGVGINQLRIYHLDGPDRVVRRTTRDKILAFRRPWTPVGIQRRLRALTLLGWSMQALADRTGIYMTSLAELRRNEDLKFVRLEVAEKILTVWDDLCMTHAPDSNSSRETSARARGRGWIPALAWDDIDDPNERPVEWEYAEDRAAILAELADRGAGISEACRLLKVNQSALQKWCGNNGVSHLYRSLAARESATGNQHTAAREEVA